MNDLGNCIHCGLCLEACPTYRVLGDEAESPRGRLRLMHDLPVHPELDESPLDRCLGCLACQSACPSGVPYGEHLHRARERRRPPALQVFLVDRLLSDRRRFAALLPWARLARRLGLARVLPAALGASLRALPEAVAVERPDRDGGSATVAILPGCSQSILQPQVMEAVRQLVRAVGESPRMADELPCCGALSQHQGSPERARELGAAFRAARSELPLLVPAAGCSAHLGAEPGVEDFLPWLAERGPRLRFRATEQRVVYHPPCHHSHAQGLRGQAEALLARVPGLTLLRAEDAERCCGSAGAYSLFQPDLAGSVRAQKWEDLRQTAPDLVLSANPGCELHLAAGRGASDPPVQNLYVFLADRVGTAQGNR